MIVKTTLSFTERHRSYLAEKVREGHFASASAAVAAAIERMIEDEAAREAALGAMAADIRKRAKAPRRAMIGIDEAFAGLAGKSARG
jgi:Arc/MetJ-type ribon-helix-helix transcriptional regulator